MRADTRPEGSDAVDNVTVSGMLVFRAGEVNQAWNCVNGSGDRSCRCNVERVNCAACAGWRVSGAAAPGATGEVFLNSCEILLLQLLGTYILACHLEVWRSRWTWLGEA